MSKEKELVMKVAKNAIVVVAMMLMAGSVWAADNQSMSDKASDAAQKTGAAVKEGAQDTGKNVKKGYRATKDETCTWVNGKMECAAKKAGHKVQNAVDEAKDKAND